MIKEPVYGKGRNRLREFLTTCSKSHSKLGTGLETHIRTSHEQRHRSQKYHPAWTRCVGFIPKELGILQFDQF